jgi:type IV pilus assembly protein PilY1
MVCKLVAITLFTWVSVCDVRVAPAAQLDLTDVPLFLTLNVIPNIFYLIDDSASMDLEVMTKDPDTGAFTNSQPDGTSRVDDGGVKHLDADGDGLPDCSFPSADAEFGGYVYGVQFPNNTFKGTPGGQNCNLADDRAWRFRNSNFNALYFDPNRVYKPWVGVDKNGNPFKEYPITAALDNPSPNVVSVKTIDLTRDSVFGSGITRDHDGDGNPDGFRYYTWTDLDGDGNFDNGEETEFLIKNADAATQQNFSNWFTYSRKRSYATKKVFGEIVDEVEGRSEEHTSELQSH